MDENHAGFQENIAAYALGSLDPGEAAALEAHLETCETCRAELADYRRLSSGLLAALPPRPPSAAVRRSLQKRLAGQTPRTRPQFNWSFGRLAMGAALAALVGLNLLTVSQVYSLRREQAELLEQRTSEQTAIAMLAYPTTRTLAFEQNGVSGSVLVDKQRNLLAVFAWNSYPRPPGRAIRCGSLIQKATAPAAASLRPKLAIRSSWLLSALLNR